MAGYFELKQTSSGQYTFNLKAGNHEVILTSQVYKARQSALDGIESVRTNSPLDGRYERKVASDTSPFFVLNAANGQVIGKSEMYQSTAAMENGIKSVMTNGGSPTVKEIG